MKDDEIRENNKLIAEFMGGIIEPRNSNTRMVYKFPTKIANGSYTWPTDVLLYHKYWDWLIPCLYKFDNLLENLPEEANKLVIEYTKWCDALEDQIVFYEIDRVYEVFVNAIKWYNKNK